MKLEFAWLNSNKIAWLNSNKVVDIRKTIGYNLTFSVKMSKKVPSAQ